MRIRIVHSNAGEQDRIGAYAKQLLQRALEPYRNNISSVAIKIRFSEGLSTGEYDYHCSVLVWMKQGCLVEAEAQDGDEILAIYRAVDRVKALVEYQANRPPGEDCKL